MVIEKVSEISYIFPWTIAQRIEEESRKDPK